MLISVNKSSRSWSLKKGKLDPWALTAIILLRHYHISATVSNFASNSSGVPHAQSSLGPSLRCLIHCLATLSVKSSIWYYLRIDIGNKSGNRSSRTESKLNIFITLYRLNFLMFLGMVSISLIGLLFSFICRTVWGTVLRLTTVFWWKIFLNSGSRYIIVVKQGE